mmetsp:Transcript_94/g.166  ORF Transcript_94/g.166 Transcript_94/m.166 type:complete len:114 (+) Transcript_94:551-892(+)
MSSFKFTSNIGISREVIPRKVSVTQAANEEVKKNWNLDEHAPKPTSANAHKRDHLQEMWQGMTYSKRPTTSSYKETHSQEQHEEPDLDQTHHKKKDWLKDYFECVQRNKHFVR